jgi:hypothetical protein
MLQEAPWLLAANLAGAAFARKWEWAREMLGWPEQRILLSRQLARASLRRLASRLDFLVSLGLASDLPGRPALDALAPLVEPPQRACKWASTRLGRHVSEGELAAFEEAWLLTPAGRHWGCLREPGEAPRKRRGQAGKALGSPQG